MHTQDVKKATIFFRHLTLSFLFIIFIFSPVSKLRQGCVSTVTSEFRALEINEKLARQDTDIGHITYERLCQANRLLPRSQVKRQLWERKLDLRYAGLLPAEIKAVASSLKVMGASMREYYLHSLC